ncbi:unnamed protein product, partial [Meganyctiphanes norvegica]
MCYSRGRGATAAAGYGSSSSNYGGGSVGGAGPGGGRRSQALLILLSFSSIASLGLLLQQQWARQALGSGPRPAALGSHGDAAPRASSLLSYKPYEGKLTQRDHSGGQRIYEIDKNSQWLEKGTEKVNALVEQQYLQTTKSNSVLLKNKRYHRGNKNIISHENQNHYQLKPGLFTSVEQNDKIFKNSNVLTKVSRDHEIGHAGNGGVLGGRAAIDLRQAVANNRTQHRHGPWPRPRQRRRWPRTPPTTTPPPPHHHLSNDSSNVKHIKPNEYDKQLSRVQRDHGTSSELPEIHEEEYGVLPNPRQILYLGKLGEGVAAIKRSPNRSHNQVLGPGSWKHRLPKATETPPILDKSLDYGKLPTTILIYDYKRPPYYPWKNTKDECSNYPTRFLAMGRRALVPLVSYPGSGNTWLRYILEAITGVFTGSVYHDDALAIKGFLGERDGYREGTTLVQKTHSLPMLPEENNLVNANKLESVVQRNLGNEVLSVRTPW